MATYRCRVHIRTPRTSTIFFSSRRRHQSSDRDWSSDVCSSDLPSGGLVEAVRRAYARLRGHYSFVAVAADQPDVLVGARKECPLVVGRGDGEQFLASGIPAFLEH